MKRKKGNERKNQINLKRQWRTTSRVKKKERTTTEYRHNNYEQIHWKCGRKKARTKKQMKRQFAMPNKGIT
jgi:hypothetical protein